MASMCRRATSMAGKPAVASSNITARSVPASRIASTPSRRCQLGGDAAQARSVGGVGRLAVEDALIGLADEGDLVGPGLHDLDAGELAPQRAFHGEGRAE